MHFCGNWDKYYIQCLLLFLLFLFFPCFLFWGKFYPCSKNLCFLKILSHTKLKVFVIFLLFFSWMLTILFWWKLKSIIDIVVSINIYLFIYLFIYLHTYHKPHNKLRVFSHTLIGCNLNHRTIPTLPLHILPSPPQLLRQPTLLAFMHFRPIGGHLLPQLPCSYPKEGPPKKSISKGGGSIGKKSDIDSIQVKTFIKYHLHAKQLANRIAWQVQSSNQLQ